MTNAFTNPVSTQSLQPELPPEKNSSRRTRLILIVLSVLAGTALLLVSIMLFQRTTAQQDTTAQKIEPLAPKATIVTTDSPTVPPMPFAVTPAQTELKLIPESDTATFAPSSSVSMLMRLESDEPAQEIDGIEFVLRYSPPTLTDVRFTPSAVFSTVVRNSVDQNSGTISFTAIRQSSESITAGEGITIGTLSFTSGQAGEVTFSFDTEETLVAGNGGNSILEQALNARISIE